MTIRVHKSDIWSLRYDISSLCILRKHVAHAVLMPPYISCVKWFSRDFTLRADFIDRLFTNGLFEQEERSSHPRVYKMGLNI